MKFVSLFAGIGGLDVGLERAGHECVGQVEIDDYATRVLEKHWPDVPRIRDVKDFKGHEFGEFDMLVGGYPCQPFSIAGSRQGERDNRHLWPEVLRILRAVRPRYLLVENVTGHLTLGFGQVLGDLAESGYDAEWDCIPAAAVGAPHRRDRVFIIGHRTTNTMADTHESRSSTGETDSFSESLRHEERNREEQEQERNQQQLGVTSSRKNVAHPNSERREERHTPTITREEGHPTRSTTEARGAWITEPNVGRLVDGIPNRTHRLRALGNAVVPQVAEWIGWRLPL